MKHRNEMHRLKYQVDKGWITKAQAVAKFQSYLERVFGRKAYPRQYQYDKVA